MNVSASFAGGILSHYLIFRKGEWHMQTANLIVLFLITQVSVMVTTNKLGSPWKESTIHSLWLNWAFLYGVWTSMIFYRLFLHPLRHFPGPLWAKVTKLWHVGKCLRSKNHLLLEDLHAKYGSFIRTGKAATSTSAKNRGADSR